jgi:hypothetical protein
MQWQVALDSLVKGRPQIVQSCRYGNPCILVTDVTDNLYMVDSSGVIRWKVHLTGKILGQVQEVFLKNTDSSCYVLNTETDLCMIDGQGNFVRKFPVRLPGKATAPLTVCLFRGSQEPQVLIPLDDNKVHSYSLNGKPNPRWVYPALNEEIVRPVRHLKALNRDFLFIIGKSGHMVITDNRGKNQVHLGDKIKISANSQVYINRTNKKGLFLFSDNEGKIIYIRENGQTSAVTFNLFTPGHTFIYADINLAGTYEFIFFDINKIYYYDQKSKLIYNTTFPRAINKPLLLFDLSSNERYTGILSESTREIFLFGRNGLITTDPVIRGTTQFDVGHLVKKGPLNIIIGSGRFVKNYRLAKQ